MVTEIEVGAWEGVANAGGVRRVRLVATHQVQSLWVATQTAVLPRGALVLTDDAELTDLRFATGRCGFGVTADNTVHGRQYVVEVTMDVPRNSVALVNWLTARANMTWLALIEDANGACWLLGHPDSDGLTMGWAGASGGKAGDANRVGIVLRGAQWCPIWALNSLELQDLNLADFSFDFSTDFLI